MTAATLQQASELRAFVANCLMGGDTITETPEGWIRDLITFECGDRRFQFRQKQEIIHNKLDQFIGRCADTTEVIVTDVLQGDVQEVKDAIERICWLLSFAGTCRVIPYGYEYPNGSGLKHMMSVSGAAQHSRPVFERHNTTQIKSFVDQAYATYVLLEKSRKLNVVIDYLAQAEAPQQLLEMRSILGFVALENLKHTFAQSRGITYAEGAFRKPTWTPGQRGHKYSFKELVNLMLRQVGMEHDLTAAIALRNDLIHTGLSSEPFGRHRELYADVHDLIREYLLRLLGYRGHYSPYAFEQRGTVAEIT